MKMRNLLFALIMLSIAACNKGEYDLIKVDLSGNMLNADFQSFFLHNGSPGVQLLVSEDENELNWFPEGEPEIQTSTRMTPEGEASDHSMTWKHAGGYEMTWTVCRLNDSPGLTLRSSITNNSGEPVRLANFILCKTPQDGVVCQGDPASWWLLPAMVPSRQAGNLEQVLPSKMRLKEQKVYGYKEVSDQDPRNTDGHWRELEEVISLYSETDRSGVVMGAVGPAVSHIQFNCCVDMGTILLEIISQMDEILLDPGETRESEEVLILAKPYKEALDNLYTWMAETHDALKNRNPIFGWCSWYDRYQHIDEDHIFKIISTVKKQRESLPLELVQIDMGWAGPFGDWSENERFPRGMKEIADSIRDAGAIPGIWLSPLACNIEKPGMWFQRGKGAWLDPTRGQGGYLDATHPEVEEFILSVVSNRQKQGFRYFKFDYNSLGKYRPYNPKMTNFQIMRHIFSLYREAIGEESFMLACGAPRRPVAGFADANRISWDAIARWKSYPIADDGLPTLQTDVFDAIFNTAMSSGMNGKLYHNDPDVTYMLPRAESHLWRGPKELFDPEVHGLKWPGLQTFHSYVGLMGGMALVSEPLYEEKYQSEKALRMLEILNPPSPDKAWSMSGDIDPWGRQFGFVAERPWGSFSSLVLWNMEDTASDLSLDGYALKQLGDQYHIWSFWDEEYLGIKDASYVAENVEGHGCKLLRLTKIPTDMDQPVIVGSNLHISMGSAEFQSLEISADEFSIELSDAGARSGKVYIYSPVSLELVRAAGCNASVISGIENIYVLEISDRSRKEKNLIRLSL